jgi:hypothetical protein
MTDQHHENATRAKRIELLHPAYTDHHDVPGVLADHKFFVAAVLADLRHYCDVHGLDFDDSDRLGLAHYTEELADPTL